ncbi:MAG: hypothetical protein K5672_02945 [Bacteroidaceae bacterium]|nr:hypothetical protein [Bacteroidaceae bacterium]
MPRLHSCQHGLEGCKVTTLTLSAQQPCKVELKMNGQVKTVKLKKGDNKIKC